MRLGMHWLLRGSRVVALVLVAALGSTLLMRFAPGYFSDSREMDAMHAGQARQSLQALEAGQASWASTLRTEGKLWIHGDLGESRHFEVPVTALLRERARPTLRLLGLGLGCGWVVALALALPLSRQGQGMGEQALHVVTAALLAVPVGVLATFLLLINQGGPVAALALLVAVREFKLLHGLLRVAWRSSYVFHARAQGFSTRQMLQAHLWPTLRPELLHLAGMSVVVALGALVPVEVVFDVPGLGQLAWTAATNRDLPVLVATTLLMALCVSALGLLVGMDRAQEAVLCE